MEEAFLILDVANVDGWTKVFGTGRSIPATTRPTVLQCSRETAEAEALRLQKAHPYARFVIFTASDATTLVDKPTHLNFRGEPVLSEKVAMLASIRPPEIPS